MNINVYEGAKELAKNIKKGLMKGAILGTLALSGGTATVAHAQGNDVAIEAEYNDDVNIGVDLEYEIKHGLAIGHSFEDGVRYISISSLEEYEDDVDYIYDLYMVDDLGFSKKLISKDIPIRTSFGVKEEGRYYAIVKEKETEKIYGVTATANTKRENDIDDNIPIYIYGEGSGYKIGVDCYKRLDKNMEYVYDMYMVDDLNNVVKQVYKDVSSNTYSFVREEGRYYAVVKEKETGKVCGVSLATDTKRVIKKEHNLPEVEYKEQLKAYLDGDLTLREATKTGGATEFLYNAIARGISIYSDIDYEIVRDAIINLNIDLIAGVDEEQMDILYPEGVNYTRLEENTDIFLLQYHRLGYLSLNKLVGDELDFEIIQNLDNRTSHFDALPSTHYKAKDYAELKETLDFFLANGEINGHKFEDLTDCGKKVALLAYERIRNSIERDYNKYDNVKDVPAEIAEAYNLTRTMNILSVATILKCPNMITNYYYLSTELIAPMGVVVLDIGKGYLDDYVRRLDETVPSFAGKTDKLKSTLFINHLDGMDTKVAIQNFGQNIDVNEEFANMEEYLNAVLEHNSTHGIKEHVSLVETMTDHHNIDKLYIAYLESYYKAIKYQLETNQLDESLVSSTSKWLLDFYNGAYIDNPGVEVKYTEHLSSGGMLIANNLLNQYKVLFKNIKTNNNEVNTLIEEVNKINLWQETKAAEQIIYDDFDKLQENLNYYTIVRGDTLWKIAQRYGMSAQQLYDLNRDTIDNPNLIFPGQKIKTNLSYDYEEQFRK